MKRRLPPPGPEGPVDIEGLLLAEDLQPDDADQRLDVARQEVGLLRDGRPAGGAHHEVHLVASGRPERLQDPDPVDRAPGRP